MECDWEVELGPDSPVIDAAWDGYVDLRRMPGHIDQINETLSLPALRDRLIQLNLPSSPVWTAKCDVWIPESFDPDEMDASPETSIAGLACYIDLIPVDAHVASTLEPLVEWCRRLCLDLKTRRLRCCRADLIVRRACLGEDKDGLGVTLYSSACGHSPEEASGALAVALATVADSVMAAGRATQEPSKYNQSTVGE